MDDCGMSKDERSTKIAVLYALACSTEERASSVSDLVTHMVSEYVGDATESKPLGEMPISGGLIGKIEASLQSTASILVRIEESLERLQT